MVHNKLLIRENKKESNGSDFFLVVNLVVKKKKFLILPFLFTFDFCICSHLLRHSLVNEPSWLGLYNKLSVQTNDYYWMQIITWNHHIGLVNRVAQETGVQSQVESYQRLKRWYLMPPWLTLSIIRYVSRVKKVKLLPSLSRAPEGSFSIATTPKCREELYSFPWIALLYPWFVSYIAEC